jgi:hypothetical protein
MPPEKDGDLKSQVEKLWREVNALKEIQALQTGETPPKTRSKPNAANEFNSFALPVEFWRHHFKRNIDTPEMHLSERTQKLGDDW